MIGAWLSVILTVGLLLCYHNTGAEQVGYRYIMDAILPILLIMGVGVGNKPGLFFKLLTLIGIIVNALSVYWWYIGRTCIIDFALRIFGIPESKKYLICRTFILK